MNSIYEARPWLTTYPEWAPHHIESPSTTALDDFDSEVGPGWLVDFESESGHYEGMLQVSFYF